jgi:hypothetical protein
MQSFLSRPTMREGVSIKCINVAGLEVAAPMGRGPAVLSERGLVTERISEVSPSKHRRRGCMS